MPEPTVIAYPREPSLFVGRTYLIDIYIRNIIREYFKRNPLQGFKGVADLVYVDDERAGGEDQRGAIRIDLSDAWNPSRVGTLPAVLVKANDMASVTVGLANMHMFGPTQDGSRVTRTRAWAGSLTVLSLAMKPRQSRLIAVSVAEHLQQLSHEIGCHLKLAKLNVARIQATRPLRELPTALATPVTIEFAFFDTWHVLPDAQPFNHFVLTN
jgi:hypothetical protein